MESLRFVLPPNPKSRRTGTTSSPTCRMRHCRRSVRTATRRRLEQMSAIFPMAISSRKCRPSAGFDSQEVREIYRLWRPSPLVRAIRLSRCSARRPRSTTRMKAFRRRVRTKPNTAVAQAYYNKQAGIKRITTETGAGQWGCSMALAGQMFGLEVRVYMVKISYGQKPYRRSMMQTWGAEVFASPSNMTETGRKASPPIRTTRARSAWRSRKPWKKAASRADTNYALGSVLNHVALHQTIIGLEAKKQFEMAGDWPDVIFAPCGGGSSFAGMAFPFVADNAAGGRNGKPVRLVAVEPASCPSLTKGVYAYDFGDSSGFTPLMKMFARATTFMPPGIPPVVCAIHGASPLVSQLYKGRFDRGVAVPQLATFEAGVMFAHAGRHHSGAGIEPRHPRRDRRALRCKGKPARRRPSSST